MSWLRRAESACLAVIAVVFVACGNDDPTGTPGSIQVATNVATLPVPRGGSGSVTVTLTRNGGFDGTVALAIGGLPADVTAMILPAQLSATTVTATVNINVAATAALATHTATITATAPGITTATTQFTVTTTPMPNFGLRATALAVAAGSSGSTIVNVDRTFFTGGVALTLLNAPPGITGVFNPPSPTADAATLVLSAASNVAAGVYPLTIQGMATGVGTKLTSLPLTVTPAGNAVEYQFCHPDDAPSFFAYQDGTGAWQVANATTSGSLTRFSFNITQGRGGVLMVWGYGSGGVAYRARRTGARSRVRTQASHDRDVSVTTSSRTRREDVYETFVLYASSAELARDGVVSCAPEPPTRTVRGTMTGVPAGMYGFATFGGVTQIAEGGVASAAVTFRDARGGTLDFIGARARPGLAPDRLIVVRDLNVADGSSLPFPIDFNGSQTSLPATANAVISGGIGENLEVFTGLLTPNGWTGIWSDLAPSAVTTRPWAGLAATALNPGDFHSIIVFGSPLTPTGNLRVTGKYIGPVTDVSLALGPPLVLPNISQVGAASYPRLRFQGTLPAEYHKVVFIDVAREDETGNLFSLISTGAYLTATGNTIPYDFTMPDVAGLAGFPSAARFTAGVHNVVVSADGFNGPGMYELVATPGTEFRGAVRNGSFTIR